MQLTACSVILIAAAALLTHLHKLAHVQRLFQRKTHEAKTDTDEQLLAFSSLSKTQLCIVQTCVYHTYKLPTHTHLVAGTEGLKFNCQKF